VTRSSSCLEYRLRGIPLSLLPFLSCLPSGLLAELRFERLLVGVLYIGLVYQVEYASLIRVLVRKLYALVLLRLYPSRSGAKPSPIGSFVGPKEFVVPIAIVEDLGTGL